MWTFTKGWPQQRKALIIKWTFWFVQLVPISLFLQLSYVFCNKLIHRDATVVNMGSATQDSILKDQPSLATIDCPILMYRRWVQCMAPSLRITSHIPGDRLITLNYSHHLERACIFILTRADAHSAYEFVFPSFNAPAKQSSADLQNTSCIIIVSNITLLLIRELTVQQMGNSNRLMLVEFISLMPTWNGFLRIQLQYKLGGISLQVIPYESNIIQEAECAANQYQIYGAAFLRTRFHESWNQGMTVLSSLLLC